MKYEARKKIIDAEQYIGIHMESISYDDVSKKPFITNRYGVKQPIEKGDFILPDSDGIHFYALNPTDFNRLYKQISSIKNGLKEIKA